MVEKKGCVAPPLRPHAASVHDADAAQCRRCLGQQNHSHSTYPFTYPLQQTSITRGLADRLLYLYQVAVIMHFIYQSGRTHRGRL